MAAISPFNFTAIGGNLAGAPALMVRTRDKGQLVTPRIPNKQTNPDRLPVVMGDLQRGAAGALDTSGFQLLVYLTALSICGRLGQNPSSGAQFPPLLSRSNGVCVCVCVGVIALYTLRWNLIVNVLSDNYLPMIHL